MKKLFYVTITFASLFIFSTVWAQMDDGEKSPELSHSQNLCQNVGILHAAKNVWLSKSWKLRVMREWISF